QPTPQYGHSDSTCRAGVLFSVRRIMSRPPASACQQRERRQQRTGRARLYALAASDTRRLTHRVVDVENDPRGAAAIRVPDHIVDLDLAARAHAASALDARLQVHLDAGVREVRHRLRSHGKTAGAYTELRRPIAELRLE